MGPDLRSSSSLTSNDLGNKLEPPTCPSFFGSEEGELAPLSYLIGVLLALVVIFFTLDLGIRKGARLAVEYAAYCGARAAATQLPLHDEAGACLGDDEKRAIKLATNACLAAVVGKQGSWGLGLPGSPGLQTLIDRADSQTTIRLLGDAGEVGPGQCLGHNVPITVEVRYEHQIPTPFSPFRWIGSGRTVMIAQATAMLHTIKPID